MSSAEGREPYGLDHWVFVNPSHPKDEAWRRAALLEPEIGLRAAEWEDEPYDRGNAERAAHRDCTCAAVDAGMLAVPA